MKPVIHQNELYNSETGADAEAAVAILRLRQMAELIEQSGKRPQRKSSELGRNLLTRAVDAGSGKLASNNALTLIRSGPHHDGISDLSQKRSGSRSKFSTRYS